MNDTKAQVAQVQSTSESAAPPTVDYGLTRRTLLRAASAGMVSSLGIPLASGSSAEARSVSRAHGMIPSIPSTTLGPLPKAFSSEEMRRRWQKVRERMKESQLDCLLVPRRAIRAGTDPDVQYLIGVPPEWLVGWVIVPYEGSVVAVFEDASNREDLLARDKANRLDLDLRVNPEEGLWSPPLIDCLREKGMAEARIGVGGLIDLNRNAEGSVNYTTYDRVMKALPKAKFTSAADLLMTVKLVKSQEEIAVLEKADEVAQIGLQTMLSAGHPGVTHRQLWTTVWEAMWKASGEFPVRLGMTTGSPGLNSRSGLPFDQAVLPAGDVLTQEIAPTVLGYAAQINHSVLIGSPAPADWDSAAHYCIELFQSMLDWIAPGKSYKDCIDFYSQKLQARGAKPGGVVIWTDGFGDGPRVGPGRKEGIDLIFQEGHVFDLKPSIPVRQTKGEAVFGDSVVVTSGGARRLGNFKMDVIALNG